MTSFVRELMSHIREENAAIKQEAQMMQAEIAFLGFKTDVERENIKERMFTLKGRADELERVIDIINSIT